MTTVRSVFLDGGECLADLMLDIHLANGNVIRRSKPFGTAVQSTVPSPKALASSGRTAHICR